MPSNSTIYCAKAVIICGKSSQAATAVTQSSNLNIEKGIVVSYIATVRTGAQEGIVVG